MFMMDVVYKILSGFQGFHKGTDKKQARNQQMGENLLDAEGNLPKLAVPLTDVSVFFPRPGSEPARPDHRAFVRRFCCFFRRHPGQAMTDVRRFMLLSTQCIALQRIERGQHGPMRSPVWHGCSFCSSCWHRSTDCPTLPRPGRITVSSKFPVRTSGRRVSRRQCLFSRQVVSLFLSTPSVSPPNLSAQAVGSLCCTGLQTLLLQSCAGIFNSTPDNNPKP